MFLCVGGEGPPIDGSAVVRSVHCNDAVELLPETGALMLALEHRFYGCHNVSACPVEGGVSSAADLKGLQSSHQALFDLAAFVEAMNAEYALSADNLWISFGGSYPGMLAGWARTRFPHLIHGAVASSAPVRAEVDMRGYYDVLASAYAAESAGGSSACVEAIRAGHAAIGKMMNGTDADRDQLAWRFEEVPSGAWLEKIDNQRDFAGDGVADFPAQSNDPLCDADLCNIQKICVLMTDKSVGDEVARLAALANGQALAGVVGLHRPRRVRTRQASDKVGFSADDFWVWQTCTQFAFYQTCEHGSACPFTQGLVSLSAMEEACRSWGIDAKAVATNVALTNAFYGADRPAAPCRVLWPQGEVDPWKANGVDAAHLPCGQIGWEVTGASHHAWTHPSDPRDSPALKSARQAIWGNVTTWLQDAKGKGAEAERCGAETAHAAPFKLRQPAAAGARATA